VEVSDCPWAPEFRLVKVGLKGLEMHVDERPASNLVFLIDVSGSMSSADKLPLLKESMIALTKKLGEKDRVGMVVYAGSSGVVLNPTPGNEQKTITDALERLNAGGSTNGGQGIELAYRLAKEHFIEGGVNRVILASDGDFNVGMTNTESLISMVEAKAREDAIFLTVLGFGDGNLKEARMEQIANKGNGNYYYIDNAKEGRRVLVDRLSSTLVAIAKDVKIQVDFNPGQVSDYRLIGYANRMLKAEDFRDDTKDAGEIGAGHTVTALYQVLPTSSERAQNLAAAHKSKYVADAEPVEAEPAVDLIASPEMLTVKLRYKKPAEDTSVEFELPVIDNETKWQDASGDFKFAAAVAGYGLVLRESEHKGKLNLDMVRKMAEEGRGSDGHGLRQEFIDMVTRSMALGR
jgi:Ca-activated chloride channel family protein